MRHSILVDQLSSVFKANPLRAAGLQIHDEKEVTSHEELEAQLAEAVQGLDGWVARQSGVEVWENGLQVASDLDPNLGAPIAAELGSDRLTLQFRRRPGAWVLATLEEDDDPQYLMEDIEHLTVKHGIMRYRRYWSLPDDGTTEPIAARLMGFGGGTYA